MDLLHPSIDLTLEPKAPRSRELLEHRFTESETQTASDHRLFMLPISSNQSGHLMDIDIVIKCTDGTLSLFSFFLYAVPEKNRLLDY